MATNHSRKSIRQMEDLTADKLDTPARYPDLVKSLLQAVDGEAAEIQRVLVYLSSANRDLRHMIVDSLHDAQDGLAWQNLVECLAFLADPSVWVDTSSAPLASWLKNNQQAVKNLDLKQLELSIIEAFVIDENEAESRLKQVKLRTGLTGASQPYKGEQISFTAAYLLGLRGDPLAIATLDRMVEAPVQKWALLAIQALGNLPDERCGAPLIKALGRDRDVLHHEAQRALSELGSKAEPALVAALEHPDSHIRWHVARALGQIGDDRAVEALADGLHDENEAVRWTSARVLANLEAASIPAILRVLTTQPITNPLRQAAHHALHSMTSRQCQEYLEPLIQALSSQTTSSEVPNLAAIMLRDWKNKC